MRCWHREHRRCGIATTCNTGTTTSWMCPPCRLSTCVTSGRPTSLRATMVSTTFISAIARLVATFMATTPNSPKDPGKNCTQMINPLLRLVFLAGDSLHSMLNSLKTTMVRYTPIGAPGCTTTVVMRPENWTTKPWHP